MQQPPRGGRKRQQLERDDQRQHLRQPAEIQALRHQPQHCRREKVKRQQRAQGCRRDALQQLPGAGQPDRPGHQRRKNRQACRDTGPAQIKRRQRRHGQTGKQRLRHRGHSAPFGRARHKNPGRQGDQRNVKDHP